MVRCKMRQSFGIKVGIAYGEATLRQFPQMKLLILCTMFISLPSLMAEQQTEYVTKLIREEVEKNNDKLLASMKSLLDISVQQLKQASSKTADSQLKEIENLKYAEPYNFKGRQTKINSSSMQRSSILWLKYQVFCSKKKCQKGKRKLRKVSSYCINDRSIFC